MINILVADDERLARENIKILLGEAKDIGDVYEAENGTEALSLAWSKQPDLIFLDIQMPGETGIELVGKLPEDSVVIFATAYDRYAVRAFEFNAIDYLLKPFDDKRFFQAMEKAKKRLSRKEFVDYTELTQLVQHMQQEEEISYKSRLAVKDPGRIRLIDVNQINYIAGAGNYAELHLFDGTTVLHRETLNMLEEQLDPKTFIRIHRSTIVRRESVEQLRPNDKGDYCVLLQSGDQLSLSRRYKSKLEELLQ